MALLAEYDQTSWRPGTLRIHESIGSIGAKYCYLNKVKPKEFYNLISEFNGNGSYIDSDNTFDNPEFDFVKLAKLFEEPISIVSKLSLNLINDLPNLYKQSKCSLWGKSMFSYCPTCMAAGYHSELHQIHWLDKCFIHGDNLVNIINKEKSIKGFRNDIKLLKPIFDMWFVSSDIWGTAKTSRWSLIDNELINTRAKKFCSALIYTEKKLQNDSILFGKNKESNLLLQVKATNSLNRVFKTVHQNKAMSFEKPLKYSCSAEIADLLVKLGPKGIGHFMHSRQITCIESEMPIWKKILNDLPKSLLKKHSKCFKLYKNSFESIEKIRIRWCYGHEYVHPPYDMSRFDRVPCPRIVTLNLLQMLLNVEDSLIPESITYYGNYNSKEINYSFYDIGSLDNLIEARIVSKWIGYIEIGTHQILKQYTPGCMFESEVEPNFRYINIPICQGILTEIIDQLLLVHLQTWIWALYEVEMTSNVIDSQINLKKHFRSKIHELSPSINLKKTNDGVELLIGTMTPKRLPTWCNSIYDEKGHYATVKKRSNELEVTFDELLVYRMRMNDLSQIRANLIRSFVRKRS